MKKVLLITTMIAGTLSVNAQKDIAVNSASVLTTTPMTDALCIEATVTIERKNSNASSSEYTFRPTESSISTSNDTIFASFSYCEGNVPNFGGTSSPSTETDNICIGANIPSGDYVLVVTTRRNPSDYFGLTNLRACGDYDDNSFVNNDTLAIGNVTIGCAAPLSVTASATPNTGACSGESVSANAQAAGGTGVISYSWTSSEATFTNGTTVNATALLALGNNDMTVEVSDEMACTATATVNITTNCTVGIEEQLNNSAVSLYPNPAKNELNIMMNEVQGNGGSIEIYNILGERVYAENVAKYNSINSIDVSALSNGRYLVKVASNNAVVTKSFVKN